MLLTLTNAASIQRIRSRFLLLGDRRKKSPGEREGAGGQGGRTRRYNGRILRQSFSERNLAANRARAMRRALLHHVVQSATHVVAYSATVCRIAAALAFLDECPQRESRTVKVFCDSSIYIHARFSLALAHLSPFLRNSAALRNPWRLSQCCGEASDDV